MPDNNKNNYDYDLGDMIDSAVQFGTQVGSSVLGSIADALEQAGDAMNRANAQPDSFKSSFILLLSIREVRFSFPRC